MTTQRDNVILPIVSDAEQPYADALCDDELDGVAGADLYMQYPRGNNDRLRG